MFRYPHTPGLIHHRNRKKLNYAELCEPDSDEEDPSQPEGPGTRGPSQSLDTPDLLQSPREQKRPRSAPTSFAQQPMASPEADRQAKLKQALLLQMEMQKRLHDQLEVTVRPSNLSGAAAP